LAARDLPQTFTNSLAEAGQLFADLFTPSLRLGVTGLSRAGKTVFITALIRNLTQGGRLPWTAQTVHDAPLEKLGMPVLLVAHAADTCLRSPPGGIAGIAQRVKSSRVQSVTVTGGPGARQSGLAACEGRSPHGFEDQDAEVAQGIARFVRGGRY